MSNSLASELDLDFQFLPSWAQQPQNQNRFANYEGTEGDRPSRRGGGGYGSGGQGQGGQRSGGQGRGERFGGGRPQGGGGRDQRGPRGGGDRGPRSDRGDRGERSERREAPPKPPEFSVSLVPDEKGVEMIARQIKLTGRSYPLFNIAQLVLKKPDRFHLKIAALKRADGKPSQTLWICSLDESIWLHESDAVHHVLNRFFETFYKPEQTPVDPPKGVYTFVAQCGMSGVILGPPNYHDYQNKLRRLHSERFSRLPFEVFKSRVKIVRDEAVVKKWVEEQSFKTEYTALNLPEPLKLGSREEVERHFRETHVANIVKQVENLSVTDLETRNRLPQSLQNLARQAWDEQKRFPLKLVTLLSQQLASHGLQFFKVNKTVTHVSVCRPRFLDMEATPVSEGVRKIVEFIQAKPGATRKSLLESLIPAATPAVTASTETAPAASGTPETAAQPTAEQASVISDLHWLVHQGHVIEFADGRLETAKKPQPKPVKAPSKKPATAAGAEPVAVVETETIAVASESEVSRPEFEGQPSPEAPESAEPKTETGGEAV